MVTGRRSFKSDESFLEKIAIGAIGTRRVFEDLQRQGHQPLELERGSMNFKIWKSIKIKRIRVPDILCVNCGRRVESRAKTNLEISMSHSPNEPERSWDFGLDEKDLVALVACERVGDQLIDWQADALVQYISVRDLRNAQDSNQTIRVKPKGVEEGFESRITWPAAMTRAAGTVAAVTPERIQIRRNPDNRIISQSLLKKDRILHPFFAAGDRVTKNQFVGAVVPVLQSFACDPQVHNADYLKMLNSSALSKRYTAAKALSLLTSDTTSHIPIQKLSDPDEHIYVKLEIAAGLARQEDPTGLTFIRDCLADEYPQHRLEAVIVLNEIATDAANQLLVETLLNDTQHPEVRAGAAWALGELRSKTAMSALIDSFVAVNDNLRIEAARALAKPATLFTPEIVQQLSKTSPAKRPGIAWALSKSQKFALEDLLDILVDEDTRHWVAYIIGTQHQQRFLHEIERVKLRDPEVYFAVTVLWKIMTSWVYGLEEY